MSGNAPSRNILDPGHRVSRWLVGHQWIDLVAALTAALLLWSLCRDLGLGSLDPVGRRATYQTVAGLAGTLLGLTMTTISVLASNIDKGIGGSPKGLPKDLVVGISKPMFGLLRVLGLALVVALIALVGDTGSAAVIGAAWPQPVLGALAVTVLLRLWRVLTLLSHLLKARVAP